MNKFNDDTIILHSLYVKQDELYKNMTNYDFLYTQQERSFSSRDAFLEALEKDIKVVQGMIDMYRHIQGMVNTYRAKDTPLYQDVTT